MDRVVDCIREELEAEDFSDIEVWKLPPSPPPSSAAAALLEPEAPRYGARSGDIELLVTESEFKSLIRRGARWVQSDEELIPRAPPSRR